MTNDQMTNDQMTNDQMTNDQWPIGRTTGILTASQPSAPSLILRFSDSLILPNASNARQGIKTHIAAAALRAHPDTSERLQCPTGH